MKRILYFSRESHFISEKQDSLLNNNTVNDAQPMNKKAVDSEQINSSENKQNKVSVDANGFVFLAEVQPEVEGYKEFFNDSIPQVHQKFEQDDSKKIVINKVVLHTKKQGDTVFVKPSLAVNRQAGKIKEQKPEEPNIAVNLETKREISDDNLSVEIQDIDADFVHESTKDIEQKEAPNEQILESKETVQSDQIILEKVESKVEYDTIALTEKNSVDEVYLKNNQREDTLISSSGVVFSSESEEKNQRNFSVKFNTNHGYSATSLNQNNLILKESNEDNILLVRPRTRPDNIAINIDVNKGNYSSLVASEAAYKGIELNCSESIDQQKTDKVVKEKNQPVQVENLIIKEVIHSSSDVSLVDSKELETPQKSSFNLDKVTENNDDELFNVGQFFQGDSQELVHKGVVELSPGILEEPKKVEVEETSSSEKKEKLPIESKVIPFEDGKSIIFFSGVNSDLAEKNQKAHLMDILSFERDVLNNLSVKAQNSNDQVEKIKAKKEQVITDKIKPLKLFDHVVKKLTLNNQLDVGVNSTQNIVSDLEKEISFDTIRDTYQKIFSAYK